MRRGDPPQFPCRISSASTMRQHCDARTTFSSREKKSFLPCRNVGNRSPRAFTRCKGSATDGAAQAKALRRKQEEAACKAKFEASMAGVDAMDEEAMKLLEEAVESRRVAPSLVTGAMLFLESSSETAACPEGLEDVHGKWRLVFSTASSIEAFQYIPVVEHLTHNAETGGVSLTSQLGPLGFDIHGCVDSWESNAMKFAWENMEVFLFGSKIWQTTMPGSTKSYQYFFKNNKILCARSGAGGVTLLQLEC